MRRKYQKWTKEQISYLVNNYSDSLILINEIANNLKRTVHNIHEKARSLGLRRKASYKRSFNDKYLDIIDTHEKAYILGLLWSDGCNHRNNNSISLSLKYPDEYILHEIAKLLNYNPLIGKDKNQRVLTIYGKYISDKLESYGMVANKSLTLEFPTIIPDEFINSFILGEFDGDGSIWKLKTGNSCDIEFMGSQNMMEGVANTLNRLCGIGKPNIVKKINIYHIRYSKKENIEKIKNFMYKNSTLYLKRKKDLFENSEFIPWKVGNYKRKLSEEQVKEIREKLCNSNKKKTNIARDYKISPQILCRIKKGLSYKRF